MDIIDLHRRTTQSWMAAVEGVAEESWQASTPCPDWTVRDLVNHVVAEDLWTVPLLRGQTIADVGDAFDGDLLGGDPRVAARAAADEAMREVARRLPAGGTVHLSYGDEDMAEYVQQLCADHLVHGWDLVAATGQPRDLDPELVTDVAAWFNEREQLYRAGGAIGPRVAGGGDPQTDLLAGFGRSASWRPLARR